MDSVSKIIKRNQNFMTIYWLNSINHI
jgi:hypothetical protein